MLSDRDPDLLLPASGDRAWLRELQRGENGLKATLANTMMILSSDAAWKEVLAYDAFAECVITTSFPPVRECDAPAHRSLGEWTDEDSSRTCAWLGGRYGMNVTTAIVDHAVATISHRRLLHPVRDYLRSVKWDGAPRLDCMLASHFGAKDTAYTRGVGARWMISAVARIMRPGCQADCMLVLESSEQGVGKSTGLRALAGDGPWFADTGITVGDKDSYQNLRCKWIYEFGELDSIRGREVTRVKNFISAAVDTYRPSFGRRSRNFPRQCVFAGTTNESDYFADRTGNRRFWPVVVAKVLVDAIRRDRDQLWAEAFARFEAGEAWHVNTAEFRAMCEAEQGARLQDDPWQNIVEPWLQNPWITRMDPLDGRPKAERLDLTNGVAVVDVLMGAIQKKKADIGRSDEIRVGQILRGLGYESHRPYRSRAEGGTRPRLYSRSNRAPTYGHDIGPTNDECYHGTESVGPIGPICKHDIETVPHSAIEGRSGIGHIGPTDRDHCFSDLLVDGDEAAS